MKVNDAEDKQPSVRRRSLLRGGAVLAGAGLAGTAMAQPAAAAAVPPVGLGTDNAETTSTGLTVNGTDGDADVAALRLSNAAGPSLYLEPLEEAWNGSLKVGEVANTTLGPLIGVQDPTADSADTAVTSFLATGIDLEFLPTPVAVPQTRLVDTRTAAGRKGIIRTSANAFRSDFKLNQGAWVDVLVAPTADGFDLSSVFINLTAVSANASGFLAVYPPGSYPGTSTLNVAKGQTVANSAFVAVREVDDPATNVSYYAVRVYGTAESFLIVDLTGAIVQGSVIGEAAARRVAATRRPSIVKQMLAKVGRRS
jgi:hypothetical protein